MVRQFIHQWIKRDPIRYNSLHAEMISARMGVTPDQYIWQSFRIALLTGIAFAFFGFFISAFVALPSLNGRIGIANVFDIRMPVFFNAVYPAQYIGAFVVILSFIIGTYLAYTLLLKMPSLEKSNRSIKINLTLHNAVAYMYAMRKGGAQLMPIFQALSERADIYGEVALEFRQIVRDADFFGYDVVTAIRHLAETTPSEKMKNFLDDLLSVIESGGDMEEFLSIRVRMYQEEARFEQRQFLNVLSLVAEGYVTLFVAGPLFLIIIMVVMGMTGGGAVLNLSVVTYAILPIGSFVFILLVDLISIKTERTQQFTIVKELRSYPDVVTYRKDHEDTLFEQLRKYDRVRTILNHVRHPLDSFITDVNHTLYITVPIAVLYIISVFLRVPHYRNIETYIGVVDDHIIIALLIVLIPYAIFYELWSRRVLGIQKLVPDFLERMSGINQVGLTLAQAIGIMVNTNLGLLSYEIRRIKRDMDWGANFTEALMRFEQRVSTPAIARTVTLITKASEMSGQISEVLSIASSDAKMSETLNSERRQEMFIYITIVYLSFFVFLFVVAVLTTQFLPTLGTLTSQGLSLQGMTSSKTLSGFGTVSLITFSRLLYHACLMQALFSGLIAGQMSESSASAGVKHACVLLIISLVTFNVILV